MTERMTQRRWWRVAAYGAVALTILGVSLFGCAETLFYHPTRQNTPAPLDISPRAERCTFAAEDGTKLCGWFIPAVSGAADGAITVVHMHGNAGCMLGHRFFVEWLPREGFNVFMFDYRGYGESEGNARFREGLISDARAALKWVRARPEVDGDKLAFFGQSLGGAIATLVAAEECERKSGLRAVVLESPFASWRDVAANALGGDPPNVFAKAVAWLLIRDDVDGVPTPEHAAAAITCPILVVHGGADTIVPVSHGRRIYAAAPLGEMAEYPGGAHNSLQSSHPETRTLIAEFLRQNAGGHAERFETGTQPR